MNYGIVFLCSNNWNKCKNKKINSKFKKSNNLFFILAILGTSKFQKFGHSNGWPSPVFGI